MDSLAATNELIFSLTGDSLAERAVQLRKLDSLSALPGMEANMAGGAAFILRGEVRVGRQLLVEAVEQVHVFSLPTVRTAEYLVATARDSVEYLTALELKVNYLLRVDSISADAISELAAIYAANGQYDKALAAIDSVLAVEAPIDSISANRILVVYRRASQQNVGQENHMNWLLMAAFILLACALCSMLIIMRRRHRSVQHSPSANLEYPDAALHMFEVAASEMERSREFALLVERKLTSGQVKDLYSAVAKGKYEAQLREQFLEAFDNAFIKSFPDFGVRINALLKENEQLIVKLPLAHEVRIAALISLGVDGGRQLSQILGLSLNTVYTYRNRLKRRALQRDTFEVRLRELTRNV